ncbi:MAG: pyridoxal phosphate-dependent aminotransferase [Candidatus Altiarchaeales archaeon]|nr:pyridoxal phosphate-dependent aminotransferase [Candidatus Altiarchaeales archaeon]
MKFASRIGGVGASATFKYSALAKKEGVVNLTIGRTEFSTPNTIVEAAKKALDEGRIHYTPTRGIPELREKITEKLEKENNIRDINPEKILVSTGAKQVIFEAIMSLIGRGDKVGMPDPSWVSYESIVKIAEGDIVWLPLKHEKGFIPDEDFLSALENSDAKLVFINSPNNPTGAVYPEKVIRKVADIAERKDMWIISDEIYEKIIYEGKHFSAGSIYPKTITVGGFSKEFSMTGWRLGYAACPEKEVIDKMNIIQSQSVSCAVSFVQYAATLAFTPEVREETRIMKETLRKRRDYLARRLRDMQVLERIPSGAFYIFPNFGEIDDVALTEKLLRRGVGVIPGSAFGSEGTGCVRISYGAVSQKGMERAADEIEKWI